MIEIEVYAENQTGVGEPIAKLFYSGRGNKVTIKTDDVTVKEELGDFLSTVLSFPKQGRVEPEPRQVWMESLPVAHVSVPYWFRIADPTSEIIEEVDDANEEVDEDASEEEAGDGGEAGGDDSGDTDDGGDGESS